jgi:nitrite reductase (NO-forming)
MFNCTYAFLIFGARSDRQLNRGTRRRAMSTEAAALVIVIVLLAGLMVMVVDQSLGVGDQISSLQSSISTLQRSLSSTQTTVTTSGGGTPVPPTTRHVVLYSYEKVVQIATGVNYDAYTFNGTVPGPTIFVNQGDTVDFTLINNGSMPHSIDFHAAQVDWASDYATIGPGKNKTFSFVADYPGVFMYHCGSPPVLEHIGNGMYGAIVVNPATPLPAAPGGTYTIIESEFYISPGPNGAFVGNYTKMLTAQPDYVVFNGFANKYMHAPLVVQPNELVRLYLLNVGPSLWEAFHVIGAIMDTVYIDGNPANAMYGLQTLSIPPSGGAIVDMYFRDPGGENPFVTHAFAYASKGALGIFQVAGGTTTTTTTTGTSPPPGVTVVIPANAATTPPGYSPDVITVVIGINGTVTWANQDTIPHTVTAKDGSFNSGELDPGKSWSHTFTLPGTYHYYCIYHSDVMTGEVIVLAMH